MVDCVCVCVRACACACVHVLSRIWLFAIPRTAAWQASLSFTISQSLLKLMSIESEMLSNYLILCYPLLLPLVFPSINIFSNELAVCIRWPKCWSFSFSTALPMNIQDWSPLGLTGFSSLLSKGLSSTTIWKHQFFGTQSSSAPQFKSINSWAFSPHEAFFMVQLSHPYMTARKTIA